MPAVEMFTPQRAGRVLASACRMRGLDVREAVRLRFGENAIYFLPRERKVVRVGRSVVAAAKEVLVAAWLADNGLPAATVTPEFLDGPIVVDDLPVTVWDYIEESNGPISSADYGRVLRGLHSVPAPDFRLPAL